MPEDRRDQSKILRKYLRHSYLGTQFFVSIALFTGLGYWVDQKLCVLPAFTVIGLIVGFSGGAYSVYRELFPPTKSSESGESSRADRADGSSKKP